MSTMFRAVKEEWGESSDCFIGHDATVQALVLLAEAAKVDVSEFEYSDVTSVGTSEGAQLLDYIEQHSVEELIALLLAGEGFRDLLEEYVADGEIDECLLALVGNIKSLAPSWRNQISKHGDLHFYVD